MIFLTLSDLFVDSGVINFGSPIIFGFILLIAMIFVMMFLNMPLGFMLLGGGLILVYLSTLDSSFNIILAIFGIVTAVMLTLAFWKLFQHGD